MSMEFIMDDTTKRSLLQLHRPTKRTSQTLVRANLDLFILGDRRLMELAVNIISRAL